MSSYFLLGSQTRRGGIVRCGGIGLIVRRRRRGCIELIVRRGCIELIIRRGCIELIIRRRCIELIIRRGCIELIVRHGCIELIVRLHGIRLIVRLHGIRLIVRRHGGIRWIVRRHGGIRLIFRHGDTRLCIPFDITWIVSFIWLSLLILAVQWIHFVLNFFLQCLLDELRILEHKVVVGGHMKGLVNLNDHQSEDNRGNH